MEGRGYFFSLSPRQAAMHGMCIGSGGAEDVRGDRVLYVGCRRMGLGGRGVSSVSPRGWEQGLVGVVLAAETWG